VQQILIKIGIILPDKRRRNAWNTRFVQNALRMFKDATSLNEKIVLTFPSTVNINEIVDGAKNMCNVNVDVDFDINVKTITLDPKSTGCVKKN